MKGGKLILEYYNRRSLRYLVRKMRPGKSISSKHTDADVYTRFDTEQELMTAAPPNWRRIGRCGIRVATIAPQMFTLPAVGKYWEKLEGGLAKGHGCGVASPDKPGCVDTRRAQATEATGAAPERLATVILNLSISSSASAKSRTKRFYAGQETDTIVWQLGCERTSGGKRRGGAHRGGIRPSAVRRAAWDLHGALRADPRRWRRVWASRLLRAHHAKGLGAAHVGRDSARARGDEQLEPGRVVGHAWRGVGVQL